MMARHRAGGWLSPAAGLRYIRNILGVSLGTDVQWQRFLEIVWRPNNGKGEGEMSITIDLPPAMAREAREYAAMRCETLEQLFVQCLVKELKRNRRVSAALSKLDRLVEKGHGRLKGESYSFRRADAYEPEVPYA